MRQYGTWVFDLDNTLYPVRCNLFSQIDQKMTAYIAQYFDIPPTDARKIQKDYYHQHGTSLRGLMLEHDMAPEPFLSFVHDIDLSHLPLEPTLASSLAKLKGQVIVYTNGSVGHAENVLNRLDIREHITGIHAIDTSDYIPKPDPHGYHVMFEAFNIDPKDAVMVEDSLKNLVTAKHLGMDTVFVNDHHHPSPEQSSKMPLLQEAHKHVDIFIEDTAKWLVDVTQKF